MNSREKLFFKNVKLHKSMSYQKREDKENVDKMRQQYKNEFIKKQKTKDEFIKKHNSLPNALFRWLFGIY